MELKGKTPIFFFQISKKKRSRRRFFGVGRVTGNKQFFFLGLSKCMLGFFARFLTVTHISFSNVDSQLAGVGLIALGVWAHLERSKFNLADITSMFDFLTDVSIFFIITGCLMFMLGFCGCLGALRENTCLIKIVSEKYLSYQEYFEMNMSLQVVVERCLPYKDCKREKRWLYKDSSYTM